MTSLVDPQTLLAIGVMAATTLFNRTAGFFLMRLVPLTPRVRKILDALPGAVLVAIVAPPPPVHGDRGHGGGAAGAFIVTNASHPQRLPCGAWRRWRGGRLRRSRSDRRAAHTRAPPGRNLSARGAGRGIEVALTVSAAGRAAPSAGALGYRRGGARNGRGRSRLGAGLGAAQRLHHGDHVAMQGIGLLDVEMVQPLGGGGILIAVHQHAGESRGRGRRISEAVVGLIDVDEAPAGTATCRHPHRIEGHHKARRHAQGGHALGHLDRRVRARDGRQSPPAPCHGLGPGHRVVRQLRPHPYS